jgi:hypothetical protein
MSRTAALLFGAIAALMSTFAHADSPTPENSLPPGRPAVTASTAATPDSPWRPGLVPLQPVPSDETPKPGLTIPGLSVNGLPGQGFTIATSDGRYSLNLRLRFQFRDTAQEISNVWQNQINLKTFRFIASGHLLSPHIGYYLQLAFGGGDFETTTQTINTPATCQTQFVNDKMVPCPNTTTTTSTTNPSPVYDAFVEFTHLRDLSVRVGQFFVPFDRARTIRESALQFVDRQQVVNELSLDRSVGLRLFSEDLFGLHGLLGYSLGIFNADGKNNFNFATPGFLYVARVQIKPFGLFDDDVEGDLSRKHSPRLGIGGAVAYNQHTDRQKSTFGNYFPAGTLDYLHGDADLVFKYAGFSFLGEFLYRDGSPNEFNYVLTNKTAKTTATTPEYARNAWGYLVQGGYMFTDFFEVVARYDQLIAIGTSDPTLEGTHASLIDTQGREGGGGVNFYLNNHALKIQADYFHYWGWFAPAREQLRVQIDVTI